MASSVIRTLFVDCYDSYSYNLVQLLHATNGCAPMVCHSDR
jgi:anthranilate/para-aminobenzoate synthase component II